MGKERAPAVDGALPPGRVRARRDRGRRDRKQERERHEDREQETDGDDDSDVAGARRVLDHDRDVDADELLILAKKIPEGIKKRVIERPDAFRRFAQLDDETIDRLLEELGEE